jgi:hypothetical protein
MERVIRRLRWACAGSGGLLLLALSALLLPSCEWDGNFTILGYSTKPNYDTKYKTVKVNIFKNPTLWAVLPVPGMEMQLTQAIVREIEAKTPYKVVECNADTEISGKIVSFTKMILNYNDLYEVRECETTLTAQVLWRDLHTGQILTLPGRRFGMGQPLPEEAIALPPALTPGSPELVSPGVSTPTSPLNMPGTGIPGTATAPAGTAPAGTAPGLPPTIPTAPGAPLNPLAYQMVRSVAHFRPELGESISTAIQQNVDRMAIQIISMMENPW